MQAYILEPDSNIQEYYRNLLGTELRGLTLHFFATGEELRRRISDQPCDLVILESMGNPAVVELIDELSSRKIPSIVVSEECTERLVVECLKAGALDFVSKRNIKLGLLLDVVRRALLEADRWMDTRDLYSRLPVRPEFIRMNQSLRTSISKEQAEVRRTRIKTGQDLGGTYEEGKSYNLIFVFLQLHFPETLARAGDDKSSKVVNEALDKIVSVPARYGGEVWVRRRDGGIFVFPAAQALAALLCAFEVRGLISMLNVTTENIYENIKANLALTSGMTVYRRNVGDVHSDALNLAAHLAIQYPRSNAILMPSSLVEQLSERARKYFFKGETFEGKEISVYERVL
jgi:DNA-binding response OmpR family regulator